MIMELFKEKTNKSIIKDLDNRRIGFGHIVAVRYAWNSYVGVVRLRGLSMCEGAKRHMGASLYHSLDTKATYQILGHVNTLHKDFKQDIADWFASEIGKCPIKIRIYDNMGVV